VIAGRKQQLIALVLATLVVAAAIALLMLTTGPATARPTLGDGGPGKLGLGAMKVAPVEPVLASEKFADASAGDSTALTTTVARKEAPLPAPEPVAAPAPKTSSSSPSRTSSTSSSSRSTSSSGWKSAKASWYGPGFYGNTMAGGGTLTRSSMVVAHRTLAFGTKIQFQYNGKTCTATVMDRGPHVAGREFDLGPGTANALGFSGVGTVKYRILGR
jgi:rare lipoprotein A (peptidoglycan hydrolase)